MVPARPGEPAYATGAVQTARLPGAGLRAAAARSRALDGLLAGSEGPEIFVGSWFATGTVAQSPPMRAGLRYFP